MTTLSSLLAAISFLRISSSPTGRGRSLKLRLRPFFVLLNDMWIAVSTQLLYNKHCGGECVKASDIKIGHIYYVNYDPVQHGEFNGKHLSVVLKRNNDKYTFLVMPMTSSANGNGVNKVNIGKIAGLPARIKTKDTFAVFDQVRTVNANRFVSVKSGSSSIVVPLDRAIWLKLFELAMRDALYDVGQDDKIAVLKRAYDWERFSKAKDLAYNVIRLRKAVPGSDGKIAALIDEIGVTLKDSAYSLDAKQLADGIDGIFDEALGKN